MEYYVDCRGAAGGDGSRARPFRTIGQAAALARAGDTVLVLLGVYREWVNPAHGGAEEARIVYRSVEPGGAVISGAEPVTGWTRYQGDTWTVELPNELFGDYNPYAVPVTGDWYYGKRVVHTGEVYFDGWALYEAESLEDPGRGSLVDTARMGLAFEPEQPFEAPDGSPIALDRDYLGQKRAPSPRVGPFETVPAEAVRVW